MGFPDIRVIQIDENTGRVTLKIQSKKITGIDKLIQIVVLALLNTPGRDVLDPERGSGLPSLVGSNISATDSTELFAEIAQRVSRVQDEIITSQIGLDETDEEKLKEIRIVELTSSSIDQVDVRLRIINEANQALDVVV